MDTLIKRIHDLPNELFDLIKESYFAAPLYSKTPIEIDENYRPPPQLGIDRASRRTFACLYYTANTFLIHAHILGYRWLSRLPRTHIAFLTDIRVRSNKPAAGGHQYNRTGDLWPGPRHLLNWLRYQLDERLCQLKFQRSLVPKYGGYLWGEWVGEVVREVEELEKVLGTR